MNFKATQKGSEKRATLAKHEYPRWDVAECRVFDSIEQGHSTIKEIIDDLADIVTPSTADVLRNIEFLKVHEFITVE